MADKARLEAAHSKPMAQFKSDVGEVIHSQPAYDLMNDIERIEE
jgi:hypothetical protein